MDAISFIDKNQNPMQQALAAQMMSPNAVPIVQPDSPKSSSIDLGHLLGMQGNPTSDPIGHMSSWSIFGGGGNPLGLSSGSNFTMDDKMKLYAAFQGGA